MSTSKTTHTTILTLEAMLLSTKEAVKEVTESSYCIISCDTGVLLAMHSTYKGASKAIEDTCDVLVFSKEAARNYTPKQEHSCSAEEAGLGKAVYNFGNSKNKRANKAKEAHKIGVQV